MIQNDFYFFVFHWIVVTVIESHIHFHSYLCVRLKAVPKEEGLAISNMSTQHNIECWSKSILSRKGFLPGNNFIYRLIFIFYISFMIFAIHIHNFTLCSATEPKYLNNYNNNSKFQTPLSIWISQIFVSHRQTPSYFYSRAVELLLFLLLWIVHCSADPILVNFLVDRWKLLLLFHCYWFSKFIESRYADFEICRKTEKFLYDKRRDVKSNRMKSIAVYVDWNWHSHRLNWLFAEFKRDYNDAAIYHLVSNTE